MNKNNKHSCKHDVAGMQAAVIYYIKLYKTILYSNLRSEWLLVCICRLCGDQNSCRAKRHRFSGDSPVNRVSKWLIVYWQGERKPLYFDSKSMVSCRCSPNPLMNHWSRNLLKMYIISERCCVHFTPRRLKRLGNDTPFHFSQMSRNISLKESPCYFTMYSTSPSPEAEREREREVQCEPWQRHNL